MSDPTPSDAERATEIAGRLAKYDAREPYSADVLRDAAPSDIRWLLSDRAAMAKRVEELEAQLLELRRGSDAWRDSFYRASELAKATDARIEALTRDAAWWEAECRDALSAVTIECPIKIVNRVATRLLDLRMAAGRPNPAPDPILAGEPQ